jgi:hypothetical protein
MTPDDRIEPQTIRHAELDVQYLGRGQQSMAGSTISAPPISRMRESREKAAPGASPTPEG